MLDTVLLILLGSALLVGVLTDMLTTTVAVGAGAGRVTALITRVIWMLGEPLARWTGRRGPRQLLGPIVLLTVLAWWPLGLIVGWSLVMSADMVGPISGGDVTDVDVIEFTAATVLGRGTPDIGPVTTSGVVFQQLAGFTGLLTVGLVVAYVLPVVSAVVESRQFAAYVSALGHTAEDILVNAWDGVDWGELDLHLIALTPMVSLQAQRHLAYPMLFSFHARERRNSLAASMVALDETVSLLDCANEDDRLHDTVLVPLRIALSEFLESLQRVHVSPSPDVVPLPDAGRLRDRAVPLCDQRDLETAYDAITGRRRVLHALLQRSGWDWEEVRRSAPGADMSLDRIGLRDRAD